MIHVDAASGTLCVGDERRRVSLDLETGTAALELDAGPVTVRALRWREKVTLARYASLGPCFVEAQFLRACTGAEHGDGRERELLLAVARWLNVPRDADALPFDARELARVTFDVCGGMRLRPADLDARPAFEVELLWQVMRNGEPAPAPLPAADPVTDGWTRIVVRPDPVGADTAPVPVAAPVPDASGASFTPGAKRDDAAEALPVPPAPSRGLRVRARAPASEFRRDVRAADVTGRAPARIVPATTATAGSGVQTAAGPVEPDGAVPTASTGALGTPTAAGDAFVPAAPAQPVMRPFALARAASRTSAVEHPTGAARVAPAAPAPRAASPTANAKVNAKVRDANASAPSPAQTHAVERATEPARASANGEARGHAAFAQQPDNVAVRFAPADATAPARPLPWFPLPSLGDRERDREPVFERGAALAVPPPNGAATAEPAHDVDALVAALSERFEEAAAEIGIAPWD